MGSRRTGEHAEHGDGGVAVAAAGQNELTQRAAAEQHGAPADERHAEEVPHMAAVGDGLELEAPMELLRHQIADEGNEEDSYKAGQQLEIAEHDGVTDAACHAQTGALRQRADDHGQGQSQPDRRVLRAGACLAELEDDGDRQEQQQDDRHTDGEDDALERDGVIGALEREAPLQEQRTGKDTGAEAGQTDQSVGIAAGQTEHHAQRAAEEGQRADHDERAEDKAERGRGAGLCAELLRADGHDERAEHEADDLRADILHLSGAVEAERACDIAQEARDAEAHVGRVSEMRQQDSGQTDDRAGHNDPPTDLFLHCGTPLVIFLEE